MIIRTTLAPLSVNNIPDNDFDAAVVIDVLRATTTLLYAIDAGASKIIPVSTIDEAFALAEKYDTAVLCGERDGKKIDGFHLGNSPSEYTAESVGGKILIYASTNGSVMLKKVQRVAKEVFLASLRNIGAAAKRIISKNPKKILIACSGLERFVSLEDTYCAGILIDKISSQIENIDTDDSTTLAHIIFRYFGYNVDKMFRESVHARYLGNELGLWDDIECASQIDSADTVPILKNGEIIEDYVI
ncbi:2-phosphosulfolactate phosphatase [bacterium]|nr:2-phosphosulfolactate phosphatase [bacterium]